MKHQCHWGGGSSSISAAAPLAPPPPPLPSPPCNYLPTASLPSPLLLFILLCLPMDKCKDRGAADRTPQLSCELCRERKVKCDKLTPCTNCTRSGAVCVPIHRKRLPRGRHAQQHLSSDEDLKKRIRRLEALVDSLNSTRSRRGRGSMYVAGYDPRYARAAPVVTGGEALTTAVDSQRAQIFWPRPQLQRAHTQPRRHRAPRGVWSWGGKKQGAQQIWNEFLEEVRLPDARTSRAQQMNQCSQKAAYCTGLWIRRRHRRAV